MTYIEVRAVVRYWEDETVKGHGGGERSVARTGQSGQSGRKLDQVQVVDRR